jgi:hypothetical protein
MVSYRYYFLDANNRIEKAEPLEATSDDEACQLAARLLDAQATYPRVEVWERARRVWASSPTAASVKHASDQTERGARMESAAETYDMRAVEFEARAQGATDATTKHLYIETAQHYRRLAREARAKAAPFRQPSQPRTGSD